MLEEVTFSFEAPPRINTEGGNTVPIVYKMDVLAALKAAGYSSYRIRQEKLIGEATLQKIRKGELVSWENIATICKLLNLQPGDIVEYQEGE
jgi:putative transcriptional regulator